MDILVDNNVAKNFCNPLDGEYKKFLRWLFDKGILVVTTGLLREYLATSGESPSPTNVAAIVNRLTIDGRLIKISPNSLKAFKIKPGIARKLRSNHSDRDLIKAVMLSWRKFALSLDRNLCHDINTFPGYQATAKKRPEELPYDT